MFHNFNKTPNFRNSNCQLDPKTKNADEKKTMMVWWWYHDDNDDDADDDHDDDDDDDDKKGIMHRHLSKMHVCKV